MHMTIVKATKQLQWILVTTTRWNSSGLREWFSPYKKLDDALCVVAEICIKKLVYSKVKIKGFSLDHKCDKEHKLGMN